MRDETTPSENVVGNVITPVLHVAQGFNTLYGHKKTAQNKSAPF
jgi:hypothetical protein